MARARDAIRVVLLLGASACAPETGASTQMQEEDEPSGKADAATSSDGWAPYLWADVDLEEFERVNVDPTPEKAEGIRDPSHEGYPIQAWLQAWADEVHDVVLEQCDGCEIPAPRVRLVPSSAFTAWVGAIPACLHAPAEVASERGQVGNQAEALLLWPDRASNFEFGALLQGKSGCVEVPWSDDVQGFVDFFNGLNAPCQLTLTADGTVQVGGAACRLEGATGARQLRPYVTAPYINITTEKIARAETPDQVLGTLFHELAHHYRAHSVTKSSQGRYGYWYEQPIDPRPGARAPVSDSTAIEAELDRLDPAKRPHIPETRYSMRLARLLIRDLGNDLLPEMCDEQCGCAGALSQLDRSWTRRITCSSCSYAPAEAEQSYRAYEAELARCARNVAVTDELGRGTIARSELDAALADYTDLEPPADTTLTLAAWLAAVDVQAVRLDLELEELLHEIDGRHLGQYTHEQEADEVSLWYSARVGLSPRDRVQSMVDAVVWFHDLDPHMFARTNFIELERFLSLHASDWREDGSYVFMPLGSRHDDHHSVVYRAFNLDRRAKAEAYEAADEPARPRLTPQEWDEFVRIAQSLRPSPDD